jgi:ParB-like chromosome segregation protein Spo0J
MNVSERQVDDHTTPTAVGGVWRRENAMDRYGFLPELTAEEYTRLKASIAERGVEVAVVRDEQGELLDGRARIRAARELGLPCPSVVQAFSSEVAAS